MTPYIDGDLPDMDRRTVDEHLRVCPPCHSRVMAETAMRDLIQTRKDALTRVCAPDALLTKCSAHARSLGVPVQPVRRTPPQHGPHARLPRVGPERGRVNLVGRSYAWLAPRTAPIALAASLVLLVGGAFLYRLTESSSRVMAAELAADHMKCFAVNAVLRTRDTTATVRSSMLSTFGWQARLPDETSMPGFELIGARACVYAGGKIAHIMYRHQGQPISLFMLPESARRQEVLEVLGHEAAIWCVGNRTFVLVAREARPEVDRLASLVRASLE